MTNPPKRLLSTVLSYLLEPLVCRIDDRLRKYFGHLEARLARLDAALYPRWLPLIIKNELCNIEYLPRDLLDGFTRLHFVGYYAADVAAQYPGAAARSPLDTTAAYPEMDVVGAEDALVFLDEYHFRRCMETHWSSLGTVEGTLLVATRFEFMLEADCRAALHSLGFIEIGRACRPAGAEKTRITERSHAEATSCTPRYLEPDGAQEETPASAGWLVAWRSPRQVESQVKHVN